MLRRSALECRGAIYEASATGCAIKYDNVAVEIVWNTIQDDLPPLRTAVAAALENTK